MQRRRQRGQAAQLFAWTDLRCDVPKTAEEALTTSLLRECCLLSGGFAPTPHQTEPDKTYAEER